MHEPLRSLLNVYKQYDGHKKYVKIAVMNIRLMSEITQCNDSV